MDHPRTREIIRAAVASAREPGPRFFDDPAAIPVSRYGEARLALERKHLFRALPMPVAHSAEVRGCAVREIDGVEILLSRGADGVVRAFRNACRHRGVRLVREDGCPRAFVCPYHNWTYGLDGALRHVPHPEAFGEVRGRDLSQVHVEERHGLVWATLAGSIDVRAFLGEIDDELAALGLDRCVVGERNVAEHPGNWKLPLEGFLDSYHIRTLHRASVGSFFLDARAVAERVGPHIRAATARKAAREADAATPLRELATPSWSLFPSTTLIAHPDWTSLVVVQPRGAARFAWTHVQLIHEAPQTDAARAHFARSFSLIQGGVFDAEDLRMAAEIQAGFATGANESLLFGRLESPALWFHDAIERAIE